MDVISLSQCMQRYHLGLAQALFFPAPPSLLELEYVRSRPNARTTDRLLPDSVSNEP